MRTIGTVISVFLILSLSTLSGVNAEELDRDTGGASYYHDKFQGRPTASGEPYDRDGLTAAHRSLPFGTLVRVTRTDTQRSVEVRVNDRGPFREGRIIDLSRKAAEDIDLLRDGVTTVRVEVLNQGSPPPLPFEETPLPSFETAPPLPTLVEIP